VAALDIADEKKKTSKKDGISITGHLTQRGLSILLRASSRKKLAALRKKAGK
jgi:hypothetical protein